MSTCRSFITMDRRSVRRPDCRPGRAGFSLLELLIVVSVLALLIAIVAGAGSRVIQSQKKRITENILITLDRAMEEYIATTGGLPPFPINPDNATALELLYRDVPGDEGTVAMGFDQFAGPFGNAITAYPVRPDAAVFFRQAEGLDTVRAIIEAIPEQFLMTTFNGGTFPTNQNDIDKEQPSVVDTWGDPVWDGDSPQQGVQQFIYYVHPKNRLAQEIYGRCVNGRPYFMSAGPDKFYGHPSELLLIAEEYPDLQTATDEVLLRRARADNIYSYEVVTEFDISADALSGLRP